MPHDKLKKTSHQYRRCNAALVGEVMAAHNTSNLVHHGIAFDLLRALRRGALRRVVRYMAGFQYEPVNQY